MSRDARAPLPAGLEIDGYRIQRTIGAGGFGLTYEALEKLTGRRVAIKELLPRHAAERASDGRTVLPATEDEAEFLDFLRERFRHEAQVLIELDHPNIIRCLRYFEANDTGYLVMPFVEGRPLMDIVRKRGPLSEADLIALLPPILDGLAHVHLRDVLHRDLKPDNILIRADGAPVILDFGAACPTPEDAGGGPAEIRTEGYAPPEQYGDGQGLGPWSDLYALGATLYRCIVGAAPLSALKRQALVDAGEVDPVDDGLARQSARYSERLLALVWRCLKLDPTDRPQSAEALIAALGTDAPETRADEALTVSARESRTGAARRPRRGAAVAIAAAILLIAGAAAAIVPPLTCAAGARWSWADFGCGAASPPGALAPRGPGPTAAGPPPVAPPPAAPRPPSPPAAPRPPAALPPVALPPAALPPAPKPPAPPAPPPSPPPVAGPPAAGPPAAGPPAAGPPAAGPPAAGPPAAGPPPAAPPAPRPPAPPSPPPVAGPPAAGPPPAAPPAPKPPAPPSPPPVAGPPAAGPPAAGPPAAGPPPAAPPAAPPAPKPPTPPPAPPAVPPAVPPPVLVSLAWTAEPPGGDPALRYRVQSLAALPDGGAVATITAFPAQQGKANARLARVGPDGRVLWSVELQRNVYDSAVASVPRGDAVVVVGTSWPRLGQGEADKGRVDTDIVVQAIGLDGRPRTPSGYVDLGNNDVAKGAVAVGRDIVVVADVGRGANARVGIARVGAEGSVRWRRLLPGARRAYAIEALDGGDVVVAGQDLATRRGFIARVDARGEIAAAPDFQPADESVFYGLRRRAGGGFVAVGYRQDAGGRSAIVVVADGAGRVAWGRRYTAPREAQDVLTLAGGEVAVLGFEGAMHAADVKPWIVLLDRAGQPLEPPVLPPGVALFAGAGAGGGLVVGGQRVDARGSAAILFGLARR
jgi:hypothetical protein